MNILSNSEINLPFWTSFGKIANLVIFNFLISVKSFAILYFISFPSGINTTFFFFLTASGSRNFKKLILSIVPQKSRVEGVMIVIDFDNSNLKNQLWKAKVLIFMVSSSSIPFFIRRA